MEMSQPQGGWFGMQNMCYPEDFVNWTGWIVDIADCGIFLNGSIYEPDIRTAVV